MRKHFKSTCSKRKHWDFRIARYGCEKSGHSKGEPSLNSERNKDANPKKLLSNCHSTCMQYSLFLITIDCSNTSCWTAVNTLPQHQSQSVTWQSALVHSALMILLSYRSANYSEIARPVRNPTFHQKQKHCFGLDWHFALGHVAEEYASTDGISSWEGCHIWVTELLNF